MKKILFTIMITMLFISCNTDDNSFYNDQNLTIPNLIQIEVPSSDLHVNDYLYINSYVNRLVSEPNQSTPLDIRKSTGNADSFVFSYYLEKKINATDWTYVNIDKNSLIVDKGSVSTGEYLLASSLFNTTNDRYEYRVGIPMLSSGQYRISFDYDPLNNLIQMRSNSQNNNIFLNIDTTSNNLDVNGYYYFNVQ